MVNNKSHSKEEKFQFLLSFFLNQALGLKEAPPSTNNNMIIFIYLLSNTIQIAIVLIAK